MKKNGFAFIETVVTVVILAASLLLLYNSYSSSIETEKERLYYDDVSYIYRTNYIRKFLLNEGKLYVIKDYEFGNTYIKVIGTESNNQFGDNLVDGDKKETLNNLVNNFNVYKMLLIKKEFVTECYNDEASTNCSNSIEILDASTRRYVKTLNDTSYDYYLLVEYAEVASTDGTQRKCDVLLDKKCYYHFVTLGV